MQHAQTELVLLLGLAELARGIEQPDQRRAMRFLVRRQADQRARKPRRSLRIAGKALDELGQERCLVTQGLLAFGDAPGVEGVETREFEAFQHITAVA